MPVEVLSFHLKPWNFCSENPTTDLAPAPNKRTVDHDEALQLAAARRGGSSVAAACCVSPSAAPACCAAPPAPQPPLSRL